MSMPPPGPPGSYPQGPTAQPGFGPPPHPGQAPAQGPTAQPGWGGQPPPGWSGGPQGPGPVPVAPAPSSDKLARIAQILCPVLVIAGLSIPQYGSIGWGDYTLWAIFAAVMALGQLITLAANRDPAQIHVVRMIATGALVAYWVVIVLPGISSNGGFLQTLGVGCAVVAAWLGGARR